MKTTTTISKHNYEGVQGLEGMYINQVLFSDINPVGKIIATRGKNFVTIQPVRAGKNKVKMNFEVGGFSAICTNNMDQEYDFEEYGEAYEVRLSKSALANQYWRIQDAPRKRYDFNF